MRTHRLCKCMQSVAAHATPDSQQTPAVQTHSIRLKLAVEKKYINAHSATLTVSTITDKDNIAAHTGSYCLSTHWHQVICIPGFSSL